MNIKTSDLQKVVNLAIDGCGQNSQIPLTQLFGLRTIKREEGNTLVIGATDTINYVYVSTKVDSDEQFDFCINANIFTQLINKFTTDIVELSFNDKYLSIVGNGEYKLEISLLENGEIQKFPRNANLEINSYPEPIAIKVEKFRNLLKYGEDALATMENEVDLNGYYVSDNTLISTNRKIMVALKDTLGINNVLRKKFVDLICKSNDDEIYFYQLDERNLLVIDTIMNIYSTINSPIENYPSKQIEKVINGSEFSLGFKVNVKQLINILDRVSLVVTKYDANIVELTVNDGILLVNSVKSTGSEALQILPLEGQEEFDPQFVWSGRINCEWLKTQLATFDKEVIDMYVGNKICIKLLEGNISKLICLA